MNVFEFDCCFWCISMADKPRYYLTTAIAYPNGAAAYRPRLRGDRDRRDRPLHAARRLRRVLPHRHRRARPEDAADRGAREAHPARAGRAQRAALPGHGRADELLERRFHPHHRGAPPSRLGGHLAAHGGGGRHLSRQIFRLVLGARRGLLRRAGDQARRARASASARRARRSNGSRRRAISSGSPPTRTSCSTSMRGIPTSCCRRSGSTRSRASSRAGCRISRSRAPPSTGACGCRAIPSTSCMCGSMR